MLLYFFVALIFFGGQFFVNSNQVTGQPPELTRYTIAGQSVAEQILIGPGLIYFWAEWCGICSAMKGTIERVLQDYPGITVALKSGNADQVRQYLQREKLTWKTIADKEGKIGSRYGVKGVPTVFFLGRDGEIKLSTIGYSSETGLRLRLWIAGLL
jgi:thiol-disulfide isomerase/thioredoxin